MDNPNLTYKDVPEVSHEAVHKAREAAQAIEVAREAQLADVVEKTAMRTKAALLEGLKEVFANDNDKTPSEMSVLIQRVPILCTNVIQMHDDIANIKSNLTWIVRLVVGAVVVALLKLILVP